MTFILHKQPIILVLATCIVFAPRKFDTSNRRWRWFYLYILFRSYLLSHDIKLMFGIGVKRLCSRWQRNYCFAKPTKATLFKQRDTSLAVRTSLVRVTGLADIYFVLLLFDTKQLIFYAFSCIVIFDDIKIQSRPQLKRWIPAEWRVNSPTICSWPKMIRISLSHRHLPSIIILSYSHCCR